MIDVTRTGEVHVLTMAAGENRFNPTMLGAFDEALTQVEQSEGPVVVVSMG